ncbi:NnrU family protein [Paraburkholderia sp. DHOC27]|uniref:NnrU family protein n=1 Tax=Paraburkholderia sp. DHOC27 TaxID=2303330 RepID=UPI000E3CCCFB|nr:NnrU family protein [Paraburkholderia sp. DHOC27]RFU48297.1 NnrU family protein [Paraburkholderia sp. DHOC27]
MSVLVLGLVIFLGLHSVRIFAESWRTRQIERIGPNGWKGAYSIASAVGLVLIICGYGIARKAPVVLWIPPVWTVHLAALLTLIAFILFVAAYVPANHFKVWVGHPMALSAAIWAFAHLVANGTLNAVVLFGAFLVWGVLAFAAARRRDFAGGVVYPAGRGSGDLVAVLIGVVVWGVFGFWVHGWLIGVRVFG